MVNFGVMCHEIGLETEVNNSLYNIVENFKYIISYFYREWHIAYETILSWKIGTFLWHLVLMIEEVNIKQEQTEKLKHGKYH